MFFSARERAASDLDPRARTRGITQAVTVTVAHSAAAAELLNSIGLQIRRRLQTARSDSESAT